MIRVTVSGGDGDSVTELQMFNSIAVSDVVKQKQDGATAVKIEDTDTGTVIFDGPADQAIDKLKKSTIPTEHVPEEFRRFVDFIMMHSSVRGVMVSMVWDDPELQGPPCHGFAVMAQDSTPGDRERLVSVDEANRDKFAAAAGVGGERVDGGIIIPGS